MSDKLLKEAYQLDGEQAFKQLFGPVKKAIGHFGKTVSASAKLIGNDVAMIIKWNCRFTLNSLAKQEEMMKDWKATRGKHLKTIYENQTAALEGLGEDKYTAMLLAPGLFWSSKLYRGKQAVLSGETLEMIGEYGADKLPIIGGWFAATGGRGYQKSFLDKLIDTENVGGDGKGQVRAWNDGVKALEKSMNLQTDTLAALLLDQADRTEKKGFIKTLLHRINSIFLLDFSHHEIHGTVLQEGEEDKEKEVIDVLEFANEMMERAIKENMKNAFVEERKKYIEEHKKTYEPGIASTEKILQMNISLAKEEDPDVFFKIIREQAKEPEFKEIDPDKLEGEFQKMVEKLAADEKVMTQLRKDLEKKGELKALKEGEEGESSPMDLTDEEKPIFEKALKNIALSNCKGGFLNTLKEGMIDLYDKMVMRVTDGLQEETMERIMKDDDPIAKEFVEQIKEFQERLENVVSKL